MLVLVQRHPRLCLQTAQCTDAHRDLPGAREHGLAPARGPSSEQRGDGLGTEADEGSARDLEDREGDAEDRRPAFDEEPVPHLGDHVRAQDGEIREAASREKGKTEESKSR